MKTISLKDAAALIPDGASVMMGGFMGVGTPERLVDELLLATAPGVSVKQVQEATEAQVAVPERVPTMAL